MDKIKVSKHTYKCIEDRIEYFEMLLSTGMGKDANNKIEALKKDLDRMIVRKEG
jgi:hypothetical protein